MLASSPLAMASPAGSSAPLLMREPEDNCSRVELRLLLVMLSWFSAVDSSNIIQNGKCH